MKPWKVAIAATFASMMFAMPGRARADWWPADVGITQIDDQHHDDRVEHHRDADNHFDHQRDWHGRNEWNGRNDGRANNYYARGNYAGVNGYSGPEWTRRPARCRNRWYANHHRRLCY